FALSAVLIIPGLIFLGLGGLKPGIDFTGGSELELQITDAQNIEQSLIAQAESQELDLEKIITASDDTYLLRFRQLEQSQVTEYVQKLGQGLGNVEQVSFITVGPTVSGSFSWDTILHSIGLPLTLIGVNIPTSNISQAIGGIIWASILITFYVAWSFR